MLHVAARAVCVGKVVSFISVQRIFIHIYIFILNLAVGLQVGSTAL